MRFSDFVIDGKLAEGGLGEVLAAREKGSGRQVVLKRPKSTAQQSYERTRDEGRLGRRVNGTAFVETLGQFEHEGVPHLVIERLDGVTLLDLWRRTGPLSYAAVAKVGAEVCQALAVLHILRDEEGTPLGAIHRDISSRNVMVEANGRIRVIDLGAAYSDADDRDAQSAVGTVIGTLPYLPPEVFEGGVESSARDVWSVGVTLVEAAVGNPFTRKQPHEETVDALLRVKKRTRDPFSDPAIQALEPRLLRVLKRMLTRDPADRLDAMTASVELAAIYAGTNPQAELTRRVGQARQLPAAPPKPRAESVAVPPTPSPMPAQRTELERGLDDGPTIVDPQPHKAVPAPDRLSEEPTMRDHGGLAQASPKLVMSTPETEGPTGVGRAWPASPSPAPMTEELSSTDLAAQIPWVTDRPLFDPEEASAELIEEPRTVEPTKQIVATEASTRQMALPSLTMPPESSEVFTGNFSAPARVPPRPSPMKRAALVAAMVVGAAVVIVLVADAFGP